MINFAKKRVWFAGIAISGLMLTSQLAHALTTEQRLERLERMANNPVVLKMNQKLNEQQRELQDIQNRLDILMHQLEGQAQTEQTTADPSSSAELQALSEQMQLLKMQQEAQESRLQNIEETLQLLQKLVMPNAVTDSGNSGKVPSSGAKPSQMPKAVTKSPVQTHPATQNEKTLYDTAFQDMRKSRYKEAIAGFESFAQENPTSNLASNAWYWAGEGQFILGNFKQAAESFSKVIELYPQSNKVSDSMLRLADTYKNLKNTGKARSWYQQLIKDYPKSRAAMNAKKRLESLK